MLPAPAQSFGARLAVVTVMEMVLNRLWEVKVSLTHF
jgi:hypothetical protein